MVVLDQCVVSQGDTGVQMVGSGDVICGHGQNDGLDKQQHNVKYYKCI